MKKRKSEILSGLDPAGIVSSKFIANNTLRIEYQDGRRAVRLHNTDVHVSWPDGSQALYSGGWRTPTTKARINEHLTGARIRQERGQWHLTNAHQDVLFAEGIKIDPAGIITGGAPDTGKEDRATMAKIRKYCAGLPDPVPEPSAGDCFYCSMSVADGPDKGKGLGEATGNTDHLESHIEEGYYPGALIMRAIMAAGYRNPHMILAMNYRDSIKRALYKYMKRALLPHLAK